jgi:hypothetical protein
MAPQDKTLITTVLHKLPLDKTGSSKGPQDKRKPVDDKERSNKPLKVHIKGLTAEPVDKCQVQNLITEQEVLEVEYSQVAPPEGTVVAPSRDNVPSKSAPAGRAPVVLPDSAPVPTSSKLPVVPTGGGHYYHKYDITGSIQRSIKKPVDKHKERVKEDLALGTKKALITPYTVVDVTNCRRECEEKCPPQLPSTPPPEHPVSEPNSRESSLKKQRKKIPRIDTRSESGSQGSIHKEPPPSPNLPVILQAEAKLMHAESRSPPPHRKVPIMIRPQNTGNSNNRLELSNEVVEISTLHA